MKQIFVLSKKDLELSVEEVLSIYKQKKYRLCENLLIIESDKTILSRFAYTKEVYQFLFECKKDELEKTTLDFNWNSIYRGSYSLDIKNDKTLNKRKYAGIIWDSLKHPKVDLKNPSTKIVLFSVANNIVSGRLLWKNENNWAERKAHNRPELHPTSLHPQLARACINLSGVLNGRLLDPFCGSGGILIEAGLIGFDVAGYDIDRIMINRARINLHHYKIKNFKLEQTDATNIKGRFDCIVTDLPYGKNSRVNDELIRIYTEFLKSAYRASKAAVILFPDFVDYRKCISKWKIRHEFDYYLHKSLSKKIVVLNHS